MINSSETTAATLLQHANMQIQEFTIHYRLRGLFGMNGIGNHFLNDDIQRIIHIQAHC